MEWLIRRFDTGPASLCLFPIDKFDGYVKLRFRWSRIVSGMRFMAHETR